MGGAQQSRLTPFERDIVAGTGTGLGHAHAHLGPRTADGVEAGAAVDLHHQLLSGDALCQVLHHLTVGKLDQRERDRH